jgi:hypothetical protein
MVYFIRQKGTNFVKIGTTKDRSNMYKRLCTLQIGNPFELELLCCTTGTTEEEFKLHEIYRRYHKQGEWFDLPTREIDRIRKFDSEEIAESDQSYSRFPTIEDLQKAFYNLQAMTPNCNQVEIMTIQKAYSRFV